MNQPPTLLPTSHCTYCQRPHDSATPIEGTATPKPGDFILCCHCAEAMKYGPNMELLPTTQKERQKHFGCDLLHRVLQLQKELRKQTT